MVSKLMLQTKIYRKIALFLKWGACLLLLFGFFAQSSFGQASDTPPNVYTPVTTDTYSNLTVTTGNTGLAGSFSSINNLTDSDITNSADGPSLALSGTSWIQVTDDDAISDTDPHPAGSYVGFVAENGLLGLLTGATISIYRNGSEVQAESIADLLSVSLGGDAKIGFIAEQEFDAIRFTINHGLISLGDVEVYYAEILSPSGDPTEPCNMETAVIQDDYAAIVDVTTSGISLTDIDDIENIIDSNTDNFASIDLSAAALDGVSISVTDLAAGFSGGYFAGFEISNSTLLAVDLLAEVEITTYLDLSLIHISEPTRPY